MKGILTRENQYLIQTIINKFSFCPCGFFCKDCLIGEIRYEGALKGIFTYIKWHSFIGKIYYDWKYSQPITGVASNEIFEVIID